MKKIDFIEDKKLYIILTVFLIITCEILLIPFKMSIFIKAYIGITPLIILIIVLTEEYYKKKAFYNKLMQNMEELKEKYLISEIISTPDFMGGRILKELLNELSKSMIENVNNYKYHLEDYKEFIELWIHEIKIPIKPEVIPIIKVSGLNTLEISFLRAPKLLKIPISFVLSKTEIYIIIPIIIEETIKEIELKAIKTIVIASIMLLDKELIKLD